ncbi:DNA-binding protein [Rhodobacter capsulatus]|uniref:DNA-binding protein n=1 Tax=Rhodobacter capsulatus TaxID=1061 RepID=UPI00402823F0
MCKFEHEFWKAFEAAAPKILGTLLIAVSVAMDRLSTVTLAERPRMADFARWITAAEPALGWAEGSFAPIYRANRSNTETAAIEGNPVAEAVLTIMQDHPSWRGTATELLKLLRQRFPLLSEDSDLPRQPNHLTSTLRRVAPLLRRRGVKTGFDREGKLGLRVITLDLVK